MPTKRKPAKKAARNTRKPQPQTAFTERLKQVLGDDYEKVFATGLGVSLSTVYRWSAGDVPVPGYAVAALEFLELVPAALRPSRWIVR